MEEKIKKIINKIGFSGEDIKWIEDIIHKECLFREVNVCIINKCTNNEIRL
jgi:hypothetical protein